MRQSFTEHLVQANYLLRAREFQAWVFHPGMRFGAAASWWGQGAARPRPHEGIDLYGYVDSTGQRHFLDSGTRIPSLLQGTVVDVFPDFLGQSILVAHHQMEDGWRFYSIMAHVTLEPDITLGQGYPGGTVIARVAPSQRAVVPAHLHISTLALVGPLPQPMSWPAIGNSDRIRLFDPAPYLGDVLHHAEVSA